MVISYTAMPIECNGCINSIDILKNKVLQSSLLASHVDLVHLMHVYDRYQSAGGDHSVRKLPQLLLSIQGAAVLFVC